jgi:hypothetical protein
MFRLEQFEGGRLRLTSYPDSCLAAFVSVAIPPDIFGRCVSAGLTPAGVPLVAGPRPVRCVSHPAFDQLVAEFIIAIGQGVTVEFVTHGTTTYMP